MPFQQSPLMVRLQLSALLVAAMAAGFGGNLGMATPASSGAHLSAALPFPGSNALTFGYSILEGNPLTSAADPGWRAEPVYEVNCPNCLTNVTVDGWASQVGVKIRTLEDCSYTALTVVLSDAKSFQQACSSTVTKSGGFDIILAELEFSSTEYTQKVERLTVGGEAVLTVATGSCSAYRVSMDPTAFTFTLTNDFQEALASLPTALNASTTPAFLKFVQTFGTHLPDWVDLGAFTSQQALFSGANFSLVESETESILIAAQASLLVFFGGDISIGGGYSFSDYLTFAVSASSNETLCKPACPPSSPYVGVDSSIWRSTLGYPTAAAPALVAPVPIAASMVPLPTVLTQTAIPAALASGAIDAARAETLAAAADLLTQFMNTTLCSQVPGCGVPPSVPAEVPYPASLAAPAAGVATAVVQSGGQNGLVNVGGANAMAATASISSAVSILNLDDPSTGWITKASAPMPLAFAGAASAEVNGTGTVIFVAGGMTTGNAAGSIAASNRTWAFNPVSDVWVPGTQLVEARFAPAMAVFEGYAVVLGGENASALPTASVECLSITTGIPAPTSCPTTVPQSALPLPVSGASAVVLPSPYTAGSTMLVVAGGCSAGSILAQACKAVNSDVWFADSNPSVLAWQTIAPLPTGRYGHTVLIDSSSAVAALLVSGGFELGAPAVPTSTILRASLDVAAWETMAWPNPWPAAFAAHATLPADPSGVQASAVLCIGGLNTTLPSGAGTLGPTQRISVFQGGVKTASV